MSHPHPDLDAPGPLAPGALRVIPLGGLGEVGRNMTVLRVRRQAADRRLRRTVPGREPARRGPDPAGLRADPGPARRRRRGRPDARPRGPHRRVALPAARAGRHPGRRLAAHARAARGQAEGAPAPQRAAADRGRGREAPDRAVRLRVRRGQPLDPGRARGRDQDAGRHGAAHRRLQDGPVAAGQPDHRPARVRPARRGGRRPVHASTPPTPRCPASPPTSATSRRCWTGCSPRRRTSASSSPASPRTCTASSR